MRHDIKIGETTTVRELIEALQSVPRLGYVEHIDLDEDGAATLQIETRARCGSRLKVLWPDGSCRFVDVVRCVELLEKMAQLGRQTGDADDPASPWYGLLKEIALIDGVRQ